MAFDILAAMIQQRPNLEKFDPLFYEGAPNLWASGSNGSFAFLNSNVYLHRLALSLTLTQRDFVNFYYWHVRADQVNSPLQFGQSGRIGVVGGEPSLVAGVPDAHLSDDFYVDWTRMLSPNVFIHDRFCDLDSWSRDSLDRWR